MDSVGTVVVVFVLVFIAGSAVGQCSTSEMKRIRFDTENSFCAKGDKRGGGRLVRGNNDTYICIDPRAVKWERGPSRCLIQSL